MSLEEARDYAVVGCVEPDLPGMEYGWHDAAYVNTAKMMEMVVNGGRCLDCGPHCQRWARCGAVGGRLGPDTGSLENYESFDSVLESVDRQFKYWADQMWQQSEHNKQGSQTEEASALCFGVFRYVCGDRQGSYGGRSKV